MQLESIECVHFSYLHDEEPYCKLKMEYYPECFICECPEVIGLNKKGGEKQMVQTHIFDSTDYGDMTLAKLDSKGVQFLLKSIEKTEGKFGDFVVLLGMKDGEPYEIRAGGRAAKGFLDKETLLVGKVISIIPRGSGMDRKYAVDIVP